MTATLRRIAVVGGGIAGLTACDTLRAEGFDGELTLVGAEPHAAYSRPALSKALLAVDGDPGAHELPAPSHGATELRGVGACGVDLDGRRVLLDTGDDVPFDALVVASGARARTPQIASPVLTLRELDDATALRRALEGRPSVVVVGGGVLGMEIASGARAAQCEVTLVATSAPMSRQLGPALSQILVATAAAQGVRIVVSPSVEVIDTVDGAAVRLADGSVMTGDVVACAIGDHANVEWLEGSGLLTGGTLVADARGRVSDRIVAAGDVAAWDGPAGVRRLPLWTSAIDQAKVAATTLLRGDDMPEPAFQPYFWTEQFGLGVKAVGELPLTGEGETLEGDPATGSALLRWTHPDRTRTAVALNWRIPIPKLRRLTTPESISA
ncbi:NAD(P)/FAD-dependent oxidoreductase [Microbacterium sp. GXF7504]